MQRNTPMSVFTVVGARPQFIKAAVVSRALAAAGIAEKIIHTGQHFDASMSDQFFEEMGIPTPWKQLSIGGGHHGAMTGRMLEAIEAILLEEKPDWVLVFGDTNSTLAGALAAAKLHIPVAHVEAGFRSFNQRIPEEINRVLTDHISERLYAPTATTKDYLLREGLAESKIRLVGDVMYDAAVYFGEEAERTSTILRDLSLEGQPYVLATAHRAENTDDPDRLRALIDGLVMVSRQLNVILPLHPRTRKALCEGSISSEGVTLIDPIGYLDMLVLEQHATVIATDSGGVQKEAFFFGVPCVTLRNETEVGELVELGWNRLQPPLSADVVFKTVLAAVGTKGKPAQPYGDGNASTLIAEDLLI